MTGTDFRFSALITALGRMWRGTGVALPAIVANAAVQAVLVWPNITGALFWLALAISGLAAAATAVILIAAGLGTSDGPQASDLIRANGLPGLGWVVAVWLVCLLGSLVYTVGGFIMAALLLFVPVAAVAGTAHPLRADLTTIKTQFGRWLITVIALAVLAGVLWLLAAVGSFFLFGTQVLSSLIVWLFLGLAAWWIATALALIYRRSSVNSDSSLPAVP